MFIFHKTLLYLIVLYKITNKYRKVTITSLIAFFPASLMESKTSWHLGTCCQISLRHLFFSTVVKYTTQTVPSQRFLSAQLSGIKYIPNILQLLPLSISGTFLIFPN